MATRKSPIQKSLEAELEAIRSANLVMQQQVQYLHAQCAVLLQRLAASQVMQGGSWDNATQLIQNEMLQIEQNLQNIQ